MPALDFSDQAVAEEAPDFSAMAEELPDFSDQAVAAEEPPADPRAEKRAQLLREQKDAQLGGRLADVGVGAARLAEGAAEVVRQTNPLTLLPRLAFEVDKKLGFVPESQPNPMDKPVFSPAEVRSALDFFSSETVKPGTATEGAKQFASEFLSGLSSPELIAAAGAGAAPSAFRALVGAAFATDMASHAPEAYKEYIHALEEGDAAEVTRTALNFVTTAAIPVAIASHGLKAEKLPDEIHPLREAGLRQSAADTALEATLPLSTKAVKATGRGTEPVPPGITTDLGGIIEREPYASEIKISTEVARSEPARPPAQVAEGTPRQPEQATGAREVPAAEPGSRPQERVSTVEPKEELVRDITEPIGEAPPVAPPAEARPQTQVVTPETSPDLATLKGSHGVPKQLKAQREYLLDAVDKAIREAPEEAQPNPELATHLRKIEEALPPASYGKDVAHAEALAKLGPQIEAFGMEGWRIRQKAGGGYKTMEGTISESSLEINKEPTSGQIYEELKRRAKEAVDRSNQIRIEIPGDGEFTIQNTQAAIKRFREIAAKNFPKGEGKMAQPGAPKGETAVPPVKAPVAPKEFAGVSEAFVSTDEKRFAITKPFAVGDRLVATDGRRMIIIEGKFPGTKEKPVYIDSATGKVTPSPGGKDTKPPNFEQVIPERKNRATIADAVSTEDLFRWTRQAKGVLTTDKDKPRSVTLWIDRNGKIGISARHPEFGEYLSNENVKSGKVVAHLDAQYLLDAITSARKMGSETVDIITGAADDVSVAPIIVKGKGFEVIIMPMRGDGGGGLSRKDFKGGKFKWREAKPEGEPSELSRTAKPAADPFERARAGDETAWADLDRQFRETYPEPEPGELAAPSGGRARVFTAEAFEKLFNEAYRDRNFDKILDAVKASDLSVYKPLIQKFFKAQATDATAAAKAEWMRAVFNGTRPPDAKPPSTPRPAPPPRPTPGPTPGGGAPPPPPPPPGPAAQRIPVDPIPGGGAKSPFAILEDFSRNLGKTIRVRRQKPGTLGTYSPASTLTTERFAGDLDTAAHELAGHWVDDKYGIAKPWFKSKQRSPYDTELAKFWVHGSVTPSMSLRYKRAEGIAEFARAYVMNPAEAMRQAPTFGQYFERTLPPEALKAVRAFSDDVRRWAGEDPIRRAGLNIRMDPPTLTEKLWRGLRGRGFGFQVSPIDWLREKFDDPYHYAVKGFGEAAKVRGKNTPLTLKPEENFELNARLLATHDSRMMDQFEFGLVPLRPQQVQGAKGLEVVRLKDPVTGEAMNLEWLNGPFDKATAKSIQADQLNTASYMIAQRTLEKFQQTGKERGISGLGAGIMSDVKAARELLAKVDTDPALKTKLEEGARRYRLWANQNIDMLIESGRLGRVAAEDIRKRNEFYVDMHRLSEEFDFTYKQRQSSKLGSPHQPIQRFKGSSLEVNNVYSNLMGQTDSIQKEAHRNMVMRDYTDMLTQAREMHQGPATDLDMFGSRARTGDRNTIPVYRNGKAELWKFDEQIYSSLKGLGDLSTNEIWSKITILPRIARYMITHGPGFAIRNPIRDTMGRTVISRHDAKPWDILKGYTQAELSRYEVFGGGQFGNYIRDRTTWNKVMKEKMREMSKERTSVFLAPAKLWQGWDKIVQASEKAGRIAEFRRAFDHAKKEFGYDDYNAALYAAGEARGLMDFAKMGTWMREINQAVPFSNAGIRGLARDFTAVKERPVRFALRWTTAVLLPTLAVLTWNRSDPETWKEYQQLPAYLRDMFWNFKVGSRWLRIPKPHLLGVLAGGVERAILRAQGDERAGEGFGRSLAAGALPVSDIAELLGPAKLAVEIGFNREIFRDREIVPYYEHQLKPELRKGEKHASGAGLGIAHVLRSAGLTADARQVDHVLNSYGGLGQMVTSATDPKRSWADFALQTTGLFVQAPTTAARDYQWVMDWARDNGQLNSSDIRALIDTKNAMFDAKTPERKQELGKKLREDASKLRNTKERR